MFVNECSGQRQSTIAPRQPHTKMLLWNGIPKAKVGDQTEGGRIMKVVRSKRKDR